MKISNCKVIETIFIRDRWYVKLDKSYNGSATMPKANYVWLEGNPSFASIPTGYVIHHLDHDELNDDISNLVLMYKHHHVAHHWKAKKANHEKSIPAIRIEKDTMNSDRLFFAPVGVPNIYYRKDRKVWIISFQEIQEGKKKRIQLFSYNGNRFETKEMALRAKEAILQRAGTYSVA